MPAADQDLASIQAELAAAKKALQDGGTYLGLKGEALQKYFLNLNEKENLLLETQLRRMGGGGGGSNGGYFEPLLPAAGAAAAGGGYGYKAASLAVNGSYLPARAPPAGEAKAFNRENLQDVLAHIAEYEAIPTECAKALKALSSLAYANAKTVGQDEKVLPSLLRALALHHAEGMVQLTAMRCLCNLAYDHTLTLTQLAHPEVIGRLLWAMSGKIEPKDIAVKASEALARIIAAEVKPDSDGGGPPPEQPVQLPAGSLGCLCSLYLAACRGDPSSREVVPKLLMQLSDNEVLEPKLAAEGFVRAEQACKVPAEAAGWLALAKVQSPPDMKWQELPVALVEAGAIRAAAGIMTRFIRDGAVQLTGIEAMSSLVGNRWAGLRAFADVGGMERVEEAMRKHPHDATIQTKGVRALGSGVSWPQDVQDRARYSHRRAVELTKTAMSQHSMDLELQIAALESLVKYLEKAKCVAEVQEAGGEGLVKMIMTSHMSNPKVMQFGKGVLKGIGADLSWQPRTSATQS